MAQAGRDTTCDLTTLQQQFPCLECLTTSEKEAALAYLLALIYLTLTASDDTVEDYRQAAVCFNCEPDSRLLDFSVQSVMNLAVSTGTLKMQLLRLNCAMRFAAGCAVLAGNRFGRSRRWRYAAFWTICLRPKTRRNN